MNKAITFLKETRAEMKLVEWPKKQRAFIYAAVVVIFSLVFGYAMGGLDTLLQSGLQKILY